MAMTKEKEKKREYNRKYYAANKEMHKDLNAKWREDNPEKVKESNAKYRAENPEKVKGHSAKWYSENSEKEKARKVKYTAELKDTYIKATLRQQGFPNESITPELIELKRITLKTTRLCRQLNN